MLGRRGRIRILVETLREFRNSLPLSEWMEKIEKEFETEVEDTFTLSEIIEYGGAEEIGKYHTVTFWDSWESEEGYWKFKLGACRVYVSHSKEVILEAFWLNAPVLKIDSDINYKIIYATIDGYFILPDWKLVEDFKVEYDMVFDSEHDGAQMVRIIEVKKNGN